MATRKQITSAILTACKAVAPGVSWGFALTGARKSNLLEGTVSCDEIKFKELSKDVQHATARYNIIVIELDGDTDIDAIADDLFSCFNGTEMGGLCYGVDVNRIVYGAVQGINTSKVVKIELDVEYAI